MVVQLKSKQRAGTAGDEESMKRSCYVMINLHYRSATRRPAEQQLVLEKRLDSKGGTWRGGAHKYKH